MPTVYTATLYDGEQSVHDFLMGLARGMGFAVTMREEPANAPLPEEFKVDEYYVRRLEEARQHYDVLIAQTPEQFAAQCTKAYADAVDLHESTVAERLERMERYDAMARTIDRWMPEHEAAIGLKEYAMEQLKITRAGDCSLDYLPRPVRQTPEEYRHAEIQKALKALERAAESLTEQNERVRQRNLAMKAVRAEIAKLARDMQ